MVIDQGTETTDVQTLDSGWRIELFTEVAANTEFRFHRWIIKRDVTTGEMIGEPDKNVPVVARTAAQVAGKTYTTSGGFSATGNQIINLLGVMSDTERQYDIDNPPQQGVMLFGGQQGVMLLDGEKE